MGELFGFRAAHLGFSSLAQHFPEGVIQLGRGKRDRQVFEFVVVQGQDHEIKVVEPLAFKMGKLSFSECFSKFDFTLTPAAAEDDRVTILHQSERFSI